MIIGFYSLGGLRGKKFLGLKSLYGLNQRDQLVDVQFVVLISFAERDLPSAVLDKVIFVLTHPNLCVARPLHVELKGLFAIAKIGGRNPDLLKRTVLRLVHRRALVSVKINVAIL